MTNSCRGQKLVSAKREREANENDRRQIESAGRSQSAEAGEHEQIKRNIKVALDGVGQVVVGMAMLPG